MNGTILSAITVSLVEEAKGGPFVFWGDLPNACETAAALGFDAVEIFPNSAEALPVADIKRLTADLGLRVAAIGSGAGWLKHHLRLTDPDSGVRARARDFVRRLIDAAAELGAPVIIGSMQGRSGDGLSREQALAWLSEALDELAAAARQRQTGLLYEPLNRYETNLFVRQGEAASFLRQIGAGNLRLLCDLFHMNIEERSIAETIREVGPQLGHIHFVDSNRQAIGAGHTEIAPIAEALRAIDYSGYLSAECLPLPDSRAAALQTIKSFRQWFR